MNRLLDSTVARAAAARGPAVTLAVLLALALFYALTAAGNLSEADDAWAFAWRAEHIAIDQASDPRLIGYHVLARGLWQASGLPLSGLLVLRGISLVGAVLGLWFVWLLLAHRLRQPREVALAGTVLLGASYGFWRYAAEGDVYVSAMALTAGVLWLLLAPRRERGAVPAMVATGALAGAAVLHYQPNTIPLFLAFPLLVGWRHGRAAVAAYVVSGVVVVLAGYGLAFSVFWPEPFSGRAFATFLAQRTQEFIVEPFGLRTLVMSVLRSAVTLVHVAASANWAFALPAVEPLVQRIYPGHMLQEELFIARQAGWLAFVPLALLPALLWALWRLAVATRSAWRAEGPPWRQVLARGAWGWWALPLWAVVNALINGRLNAAGNEAWIVFLLPVLLIAVPALLAPAWRHGGRTALWVGVAALVLHNAVGMAMVRDPAGDLIRQRSAWLVEQATERDVVIVVYDLPRADHLRLYSRANVVLLLPIDVPRLAEALKRGDGPLPLTRSRGRDFIRTDAAVAVRRALTGGGRVLFFEELLKEYSPLAMSNPAYPWQMKALRDAALPVQQTPFDTLYEFRPPATR
jgi:hypothetical protein